MKFVVSMGRGRRQLATPRRRSGGAPDDEGFIVIDALVGLTLLTTAIALTLTAGRMAIRLTSRAAELDAARTELIHLVEAPSPTPGAASGLASGFSWSRKISLSADASPGSLCQVDASLTAVRSQRSYVLSTLRPCAVSAS